MNQEAPPKINDGPAKRRKPSRVLMALIGAIVLGLVFFIALPFWLVHARSEKDFQTARTKLDPERLREWALAMAVRYPPKEAWADIPKEEVPTEIKTAFEKPPDAIVSARNGGVELRFGGGFAHWFIAIGPTNSSWPSGGHFRTEEWVPGIYFVREL